MAHRRFAVIVNTFLRDLRASTRLTADAKSCIRLSVDFIQSRFIGLVPKGRRNRLREVRFRGDIMISYRLNKGDLHSIREIWFQEAYRLPFAPPGGVLLDLGANIGLTSLWLAKKYSFTHVIAVEPDSHNALLARRNLERNHIPGQVLEAAIGPKEGIGWFQSSEHSMMGRLAESGSPVPMISVTAIIDRFAVAKFGLIKIDIEGAEKELFNGPTDWLARTYAIIIELHPAVVDCDHLTRLVSSHGFRYIPANSLLSDNMDCFVRAE